MLLPLVRDRGVGQEARTGARRLKREQVRADKTKENT